MYISLWYCIPILFICLLAFLDNKPFYWPEELLLCSCPNCGTLRSRSHRASGHKAGEWLFYHQAALGWVYHYFSTRTIYLSISLSLSIFVYLCLYQSIYFSICLSYVNSFMVFLCNMFISVFFPVIGLIQCLPILSFPVLSVYLCCSICVSTCLSVCLSIVRDNHV